ncbi:long-chain fatty acid--CoA ligase [Nocardia tengchongensis]|uniref:long-chain fatty acid--CoA ligase n=1 Tax=Nocardia tengchongensis TaxID=2055889 RepID=UPI0036BABA4C
MRGMMQDRQLVLPYLLDRMESRFSTKRVITSRGDGEVIANFADVAGRVRRLAAVLDDLNVPADARIGTFAWNSQRHLELYLAVPSSGRVLHTVNHRLFADQITYIVNNAEDDILFVDRSILPVVWPLMPTFTTVRHVIVMDDGDPHPVPVDDPRVHDYDALVDSATPADDSLLQIDDERTAAALCYTSGTTGRPKGVLYDHRSIVLHALMLQTADAFALSENDVIMPIVPMFHVNAWGLPYAAAMCGADLVMPGTANSPAQLIDQIERHRVTFTAAVPTVWRNAAAHLHGRDLSSLRRIVCGGGAVPLSLSKLYEDTIGQPLCNAWGMTETSPVVTSAYVSRTGAEDLKSRGETLAQPGVALPLTSLRIVDSSGRPAPWDGTTPGELQVAGPTIAGRYFGDKDTHPSDAFTTDGWLRTGDVATISADGQMKIIDRTKDLIKSGGEWISSVELENEIMAHPDVVEAAVIATPDERWSERPLACVVARANATLTAADIQQHLYSRVAKWWIPDSIVFVADIPKTATGKFSKIALRELVRARTERRDE